MFTKKSRVAAVLALGMVSVGVAGCGGGGAPTASGPKQYTIALVPGITTDPFYLSMKAGAEHEAKKLGVKLIWAGASQWSYEQQTPVVNSLVAKKVNFLLIAPTDVNAMQPPIQNAVNAGIPVGTVDTTINDTKLLKFRITSNNISGGAYAADWLAKKIDYKGDVALINVEPGIYTTDLRQQGFLQEIKKYPNVKVVSIQYDNDQVTTAESEIESILLKYPNLKGVYATNTMSGTGVAAGLAARGKIQNASNPSPDKVWLIAYDAEPPEVKDLNKGWIQALIVQKPYLEGEMGVKYAYDYLTGHKSQIQKSVFLTNVLATQANEPTTSKWFYTP